MSKNLSLLLLIIIFLFVNASGQKAKVDNDSILDRQINQSDFEDEEVISGLMKSFYSIKVPAGVSKVYRDYTKDEFETKFSFSSKTLSLREILEEVTNIESRYSWKEENGVVNVFPIDDYTVLNSIISEFHFENKSKEVLLSEVLHTKEFQEYLKENQLSVFPLQIVFGLQGKQVKSRRFTIDLKNVTVREILNEIVRQNGKSTWIYSEYKSDFLDKGNPKQYYRLDFLVDTP